ncbi:plastocyanin/azurin family copper-binding protein [Haladaptatus sp. NG-SE-30]
MHRRKFLTYASVAGVTSLAGCPGQPEAPIDEETTEQPFTETTEETTEETTTEETTTPETTTEETTTSEQTTTGGASGEIVDVAAGPEGRLRFVPEEVEISVGGTVRWTFESAGHNVTTKPGASEKISIPENAEPFGSYEGDAHYSINEVGTTYEHTFTVPGEYVYVCAPHAGQGMVGTVTVTE